MMKEYNIKIHKECISESYSIYSGIATLSHEKYVCPFCSHGDTIEVHVRAKKSSFSYGIDYEYYLSCLGSCFSYKVVDILGTYRSEENDNIGVCKSIECFKKLIDFSENFKCHIKNIDFIMTN